MLRKIASMLFQEEEIVLEEDLKSKDNEGHDIQIPEIKPISVLEKKQTAKESPIINDKVEEKAETVNAKETDILDALDSKETSQRSNRITADYQMSEEERFELPKIEKKYPSYSKEDYRPQEIISPIFGGSQSEKSLLPKENKIVKTKTSTTVISPMYGLIEAETNDVFDEDLLNYELKDMLSPNEVAEEVQVSLYDFLEDLKNEK